MHVGSIYLHVASQLRWTSEGSSDSGDSGDSDSDRKLSTPTVKGRSGTAPTTGWWFEEKWDMCIYIYT